MDYLAKYQTWVENPNLLKEEKEVLLKLSDNDIKEAFYSNLEFGTGGLRGLMGLGTNRVNLYTIAKVTLGLANDLINQKVSSMGVAISYDNRHNSKEFAFHAAKVLAAKGIKSYLFSELRPTPMLSFALRHFNCGAGIMITASHNPKEYNGYKVYNQTGAQLTDNDCERLIKEINKVEDVFTIKAVANDLIYYVDELFDNIYLDKVRALQITNEPKKIKIVYSPLHGTGGTVIPKLLTSLGYDLKLVSEQMVVDPNFSSTKSSNPEDSVSFDLAISYAKAIAADVIFVTDPDADRLGVAINVSGQYQLLTGNKTAALMLDYILKHKKVDNGFVYTTIVTTELIKLIAKSQQQNVSETLTGFKYIGERMALNENKGTFIFGCEESYGSLIEDFVRDKDAVSAVLLLAEMVNYYKNNNLSLLDVLNEIYTKYGYYDEYTHNIGYSGIEGKAKIAKIMNHFRTNDFIVANEKPYLKEDYLNGIIKDSNIKLPEANVVKFYFNNIWVVLRPSGTEPKLKVYFCAKADSIAGCDLLIKKYQEAILNIIAGL